MGVPRPAAMGNGGALVPGSGNVQRTLGGMYRGPENRRFRRVQMNLHNNYKIGIQRINFFYLIYIHGEITNNFM